MEWYLKVLREYATFSGRARRKEYWMFILFNFIISLILTSGDFALGFRNLEGGVGLSSIYSIAILIPSLAVSVRRLHDVNKTGWWLLIAFIPLIGAIWLIILHATEGDKGTNQYGQDPKNENAFASDDILDSSI